MKGNVFARLKVFRANNKHVWVYENNKSFKFVFYNFIKNKTLNK